MGLDGHPPGTTCVLTGDDDFWTLTTMGPPPADDDPV